MLNVAEFVKAQQVLRDTQGGYSWARCEQCNEPATHFVWDSKDEIHLFCTKNQHAPKDAELIPLEGSLITDYQAPSNPLDPGFKPENLEDTVGKLTGSGVAKLRSKLNPEFGALFRSTGPDAQSEQTIIIAQTVGASPENPYVLEFEQFIIDPFTGPGQFDLVERDAGDEVEVDEDGVMLPGENDVTIATSAGFTDGATEGSWSRLVKPVTSDKIYSAVFAPGTTGDGIFLISAQALYATDPPSNPEVE